MLIDYPENGNPLPQSEGWTFQTVRSNRRIQVDTILGEAHKRHGIFRGLDLAKIHVHSILVEVS
jgi:hypothetical protein